MHWICSNWNLRNVGTILCYGEKMSAVYLLENYKFSMKEMGQEMK